MSTFSSLSLCIFGNLKRFLVFYLDEVRDFSKPIKQYPQFGYGYFINQISLKLLTQIRHLQVALLQISLLYLLNPKKKNIIIIFTNIQDCANDLGSVMLRFIFILQSNS